MSAISIDFGSHVFEDASGVTFHEQTHYFLSSYTNYGAVHNLLSEITARKDKLIVNVDTINKSIKQLFDASYFVQEGFAHLMQAKGIFDESGDDGVKDWISLLPNAPKIAITDLLFTLKFDQQTFNAFTEKIGPLAMQTDLHLQAIADPTFILDQDRLSQHLSDETRNPNRRLAKLRVAVEKDNSILSLDLEKISEKVGLPFTPYISNGEKADLVNVITGFTSQPANISEKDILSLSGAEEIFRPSYETMVIRDANLENNARVGLPPDSITSKLAKLRTLFVYNNPESPQAPGKFGYYAFLAPRVIVNSSMSVDDAQVIVEDSRVTRIVDTHAFNYETNVFLYFFVYLTIYWYVVGVLLGWIVGKVKERRQRKK